MEKPGLSGSKLTSQIIKLHLTHTYGGMTEEDFNKIIDEILKVGWTITFDKKEVMPKETKERLKRLIDEL